MNNSDSLLKQDLDHSADQFQPQRRPRGFAATAAAGAPEGKGRKEREREKERTKLRERHRRAITSRMLAGLRQYGNFTLPARADMNDVLAALAREAGWTVEADGTTYRPSPPSQLASFPVRPVESPLTATSLKNCAMKSSLDCQPSVIRVDESLSPTSLASVVPEKDAKNEKFANSSPINSPDCLEADHLMHDMHDEQNENDFTGTQGTPCLPVYVILPIGIINNFCQLVDEVCMRQELRHLESLNIDGVIVACWWGIVEQWSPQKYVWTGYRDLFNIIREANLKLQVVMAFHEYWGNQAGDMQISLPKWVLDIGKDNADIFFTDREGRRNTECLSWGIDRERVLKGRTGIEVYFDFMRSFRMEFDDLFMEGIISAVEIGLGASGELKYPSFPERMGWRYPGIGEFQCYDKYLQQSLRRAAKARGHIFWARGPDNAGQYNSRPNETGFFCERGDYDSYYGRFFLQWYSKTLIEHADNVLSLATLAFEKTQIIVKSLWGRTRLPSAFEDLCFLWNDSGTVKYQQSTGGTRLLAMQRSSQLDFTILQIRMDILQFFMSSRNTVTLKFVCVGLPFSAAENDEALADCEALYWQVLNSAWDHGLNVAGQNVSPCYDGDGYSRIIETAKPRNHPDHRHLSFFAYQLPAPGLVQRQSCLPDFDYFIKCMHGEVLAELHG